MQKTPIKELVHLESSLTHMFDSDIRIAMSILDHIRTNKARWVEEEQGIINTAFSDGCEYCRYIALEQQNDDFYYDYYKTKFLK
jgi:hypothetical protein